MNEEHSNTNKQAEPEPEEQKSFLQIVVHSFFIVPFLIAVFCVLLFAGMHLLTRENRSVYDYLNDVKIGGQSKRWQGAFELSKILSNTKLYPDDGRFSKELIRVYEKSDHDDPRVKQYLALAMGRTQRDEFVEPLAESLPQATEENLPAIIYALGMLKSQRASENIVPFLNHQDSRVRSIAVVALGEIADPHTVENMKKLLQDPEPNVQWGSALALARLKDPSGKDVIASLLDRNYLSHFKEVDRDEQHHLMIAAMEASWSLKDKGLLQRIQKISETDSNLKVRAAAQNIIVKYNEQAK
ncbi:MAG: HEAT repeat domain-containing protein [Candidatus Omnitrophica bacterium]|nr:HEAT repeat domain-containing protein [Candidatus Omnitrophota bacterium]